MQEIKIFEDDIVIKSEGKIFCTVINEDGTSAKFAVRNKVLLSGRVALAKSLANQINDNFNFYIARILFGNSGSVGGSPRFIEDNRDGLFGPVILAKPVIATIDPIIPQQVTFTTTVNFGEIIGQAVDELGLEMANGDLFSLATFGQINKTSTMQLIFNWRIVWI